MIHAQREQRCDRDITAHDAERGWDDGGSIWLGLMGSRARLDSANGGRKDLGEQWDGESNEGVGEGDSGGGEMRKGWRR